MTDKKRSLTVIAATAANRIIALREQCEEELANAPESIRARFAERERKAYDSLAPEVRPYVVGILEAHYRAELDATAVDDPEPKRRGRE